MVDIIRKTPPQLSSADSLLDGDLLLSWRGAGPLRSLAPELAAEYFSGSLTYESTLPGAAMRPLVDKLGDQVSIKDFLDDSGNPIDGDFSVIDDALDFAFENNVALYFPPGDYMCFRQHDYLPEALVDVPPLPNPSATGAFARGLSIHGSQMIQVRIHSRVPDGFLFKLNVTNPDPYAYRAEMGNRFENFTIIGLSSIANSGGIEMFNCYQGQINQLHIRNLTGTAIKLVNGLEGDVPDSGWNCQSFRSLWIENCGLGGNGWGIDATGTEGRNEGSFTSLTNVFIQGCGKNQYFSIASPGVSTANPAIVTLNLNQMPAASPTATAHPFVVGDRVKGFGIRKTQTLGANPITTVAGTAVVTIASTAHGLAIGDNVNISGAAAVGGITLSGDYQITSLPGSGSFTVIHSSAATSGATGGGAAVVLLSPMKAVDDVDFYVGPVPTATTIQLYSASGAALALPTDPLATVDASPTVTVTRTAHGFSPGDIVVINFATEVNGLHIDKGYAVQTVPDANTFTITASSNATGTGSGGGAVAKAQKIVAFNGASVGTWVSDLATPTPLANNPISTVDLSATVTITHAAHGAVAGDLVTIAGATAVGGLTISGQYRVVTVPTSGTFTITAASAANATATGGGAAVTAQYTYRATIQGEIGYYEPQSGGMRYKGQLLKLNSCGFTINYNCAQYIKGGAGGAIGVYCEQVTWENNYRRHFFAKGGINYLFLGNQFHGNNVAGLRQWRLAEFDASEYAIQNVLWQNNKVRAKECPSVAFKYSGAQSSSNNIRVRGTLWSDYDYPGQVRYLGVPFDQIDQNLILTFSSTTAMILRPDQFAGGGNTTPLKLRGPQNDSGTGAASLTGEWIEWKLSSNNGLTLSNSGLANSTLYYVYGFDNDGVMALTASVVPPAIDVTHGYQTLPGDPTMLFVGEAQTDGAGAFTTTGHGFLQPRRIGGAQSGSQAWEWDDWVLERSLKRSGARPTSATQSTQVLPWVKFGSKSFNFSSIAAGASEITTITGVANCAVGDIILGVALNPPAAGVHLSGEVTAAGVIEIAATNKTTGAIDPANGTITAAFMRMS